MSPEPFGAPSPEAALALVRSVDASGAPSPEAALALVRSVDASGAVGEALARTEALEHSSGHTRADLLRGAALAGAGMIGVAAGAAPAQAAIRDRGDVAILNYALSLEYLQAAFYTEAERRGALTGALAQQARVVGSHERAHVAALRQQLADKAIKRPAFDFHGLTESAKGFRDTAVAFEDLSVAAYQDKAPLIASRGYLVAVVGIQSVEARHAAWIRRLAGVVPAPDAFDQPLTQAHAEKLVAATHFVARRAQTSADSPPRFTG